MEIAGKEKHEINLIESCLLAFNIPNLRESQPLSFIQVESRIVSCVFGFSIPNLIESQPVIDKQLISRIVSKLFFNNPCFIESQPESLITTGGVDVGVDSVFEQE